MSLSEVQGIQTALLIFSHSFYNEPINRLVRNIDFCKVMQIFYPFSLQLHPYKHPGVDPGDCKPGLSKTKNAKYCLIRDARLTEHKQHWWWKANFIFQGTRWLQRHANPVVFLEEDNYVAPDFLYMFQYITRSLDYFPSVDVMSFGTAWTKNVNMNLLTVESWRPPYDIGLAFNKTTWQKILQLSGQFCMYNDYSWSYSLLHVFESFPKGYVDMVGCVAPRVLSTKEYDNNVNIFKKKTELFSALNLFPKKVHAVFLFGPEGRVERVLKGPPVGRGGWNDLRDQLLCLDPMMSTTTEEKRYNEYEVTRS
nr:alpha-1,6-mannosyl-glycoprotein 2-beta-N-acetylglucosaminyltransferase-like [Vanessa tameamea]